MKRLFIVLMLVQSLTGFGQEELKLVTSDFDLVLDSAKKLDKDIFLITRSFKCHVFEKFKTILTNDKVSIKYLNANFIIYEYDMDKASDDEKKRMRKYYHSWRGFPQLYFIDKNEKLISDLDYPLRIEQQEHLEIWKDYRNIETNWKRIKHLNKCKNFDYDELKQYLTYRQIKYSSFDLIQIKNILDKYFENLDSINYSTKQNWDLIQKYITIYSNPEIFDLVAKHKSDFQKNIGDSIIYNYLSYNYLKYIDWRKPEKVDKIAKKYPYNTIPEAIGAIEIYKKSKNIQSLIEYSTK
jgi:hypothetical protein